MKIKIVSSYSSIMCMQSGSPIFVWFIPNRVGHSHFHGTTIKGYLGQQQGWDLWASSTILSLNHSPQKNHEFPFFSPHPHAICSKLFPVTNKSHTSHLDFLCLYILNQNRYVLAQDLVQDNIYALKNALGSRQHCSYSWESHKPTSERRRESTL